jgi:hypothetical protein
MPILEGTQSKRDENKAQKYSLQRRQGLPQTPDENACAALVGDRFPQRAALEQMMPLVMHQQAPDQQQHWACCPCPRHPRHHFCHQLESHGHWHQIPTEPAIKNHQDQSKKVLHELFSGIHGC